MTPAPLARISRAALDEARALATLDAVPSTEVLKAPELGARRRRIEWMRHVAQAGFLLTIVVIGWEFIRWVRNSGLPVADDPLTRC